MRIGQRPQTFGQCGILRRGNHQKRTDDLVVATREASSMRTTSGPTSRNFSAFSRASRSVADHDATAI